MPEKQQVGKMGNTTLSPSLEKTLNKLLELRRGREKRDYFAYSKTLLDATEILQKSFGGWVDSEMKDLVAQIELLLQASDGQAKERLEKLRTELDEIKSRKLPEAQKNLKIFIRKMKRKELTKTSNVIHALIDEVEPSVSIMGRLNSMRSEIDSLADMTLSVGGSVEEITPQERTEVERSLEDVAGGRARKSSSPDEVISYLRSD